MTLAILSFTQNDKCTENIDPATFHKSLDFGGQHMQKIKMSENYAERFVVTSVGLKTRF